MGGKKYFYERAGFSVWMGVGRRAKVWAGVGEWEKAGGAVGVRLAFFPSFRLSFALLLW